MSKSRYGCGMWTTLFCLAAFTLASPVQRVAAQATIAQQVAVPAYFSPGHFWTQLDNSVPSVGIAVANVDNGPGNLTDPNVAGAIQAAHNAGIKVLGYVNTGLLGTTGHLTRLGTSDMVSWEVQIESDVNAWYSFYGSYGIDGIFFDQLQNVCGPNNVYANVYTEMQNYVKQNHLGAWVAGNAGSPVPQCYQNAADILVTFENTYACYSHDSSCPQDQWYVDLDWNPVDPQKIWHLIYDTSESQLANASSLSKQRNAGYFYITSGILPNPWDFLPTGSYWTTEVSVGGTLPNTPPTPPVTLDIVDVGATWAMLNWGASTDNSGSGVVGYDIYENGVKTVSVAASSNPQVTIMGLTPSTLYTFNARARDAAGDVSDFSNTLQFTTDVANGSVSAPGNLTSTQIGATSAALSWTPSTACCDYAIAYYDVYQEGTKILTLDATVTSVTVIGLTPGSNYTFTVQARDTQGDISPSSNSVSLTTNSLPGGLANTNCTSRARRHKARACRRSSQR